MADENRDDLYAKAKRLSHESEAAWKEAASKNPWFESSKDGGASIDRARAIDAEFDRVTEKLDKTR